MSNSSMKILAKETAIYGLSSIIGKFLNWLLVPLYTYVLAQQSDYGIVTNLYAWTALLLVILTYGMETGFFRFANKEGAHPNTVYVTAMVSLFTTSLLFAVLCCVFRHPIADALGYPDHSEFIALLSVVVAMDAFACIPFAYLRYKRRPLQFAALKLLFVFLNILLNLFFLVLCPKIQDAAWVAPWYNPDYGVGYVFVANILATGIQTLCLLPYILEPMRGRVRPGDRTSMTCPAPCPLPAKFTPLRGACGDPEYGAGEFAGDRTSFTVRDTVGTSPVEPMVRPGDRTSMKAGGDACAPDMPLFSFPLLKDMLRYSLPLLVLGVCGIMNQTLDRILFPFLYTAADAQAQLGIYGACFKVAMVMMMFTQAFRYAYEPFVFAKHKDKQSVEAYADAMKYYILFSYLILLGMVFYLDLLKYIIAPTYWEGLKIVPVVLWAYIFQGVYFNLSFWYKLTDKTQYGAYFSLIGVVITFVLQVIFVPRVGYMASAASSAVCYFIIMLLSYLVGRKYLTIPYDFKKIGAYTLITLLLLGLFALVAHFLPTCPWAKMGIGTVLLLIYIGAAWKIDLRSLLGK